MIGFQQIKDASDALEGVAHRTPVIESRSLNEISGLQLFFKAETLQRTGSFKFRGAYNALRQMTAAEKQRGVVTYSSGNHGQAVALSAQLLGTDAVVVMPSDAPKAKQEAARAYGATIVPYDRMTEDRLELASKIAATEGRRLLVQPYDDERVIAGQGTIAVELAQQCGPLDAVIAPIGGGGLISGIALGLTELMPSCEIVGAEPSDGDDTKRSLAAGSRVSIPAPRTIADGLRATQPGELTFPIVQRFVRRIIAVSDAEILGATRLLFERLKLVVEPSGACSVAATLRSDELPSGSRVGVILSGGNVDPSTFADILSH